MNFKKELIAAGLKMYNSGLTIETWGNISLRDPKTNYVYMTPSAMSYDSINEDDIIVCKLDGEIVEGKRKPTIEKDLHLAIFNNRPEVNAIIHTHPMYSMIYACQGKDIRLITDEAAQALGDVCRCADYALPGTKELSENCSKALGKIANSCLLQSHGAVGVGCDLEAAFRVCKVLEVTAEINYMIEASNGSPIYISNENIEAMKNFVKNCYGQDK